MEQLLPALPLFLLCQQLFPPQPGTARVGSPPVLVPLSSHPGGNLAWNHPSCPGLLQDELCPCPPCALIQSPVSAGPRSSSLLMFNIKNNPSPMCFKQGFFQTILIQPIGGTAP